MNITVTVKDAITPDLQRRMLALQNRRPVLEAAGLSLLSQARQAFENSARRAAPWPPKKDGSPATLRKNNTLFDSLRVKLVTNDSVHVGTDRKYAPVHQLGSRKGSGRGSGIPARPFFPILGGQITPRAKAAIGNAIRAELDAQLR
jgi:phage gpG-like protein